jgi:hypothetical protein
MVGGGSMGGILEIQSGREKRGRSICFQSAKMPFGKILESGANKNAHRDVHGAQIPEETSGRVGYADTPV